jgi:hypothetical protein
MTQPGAPDPTRPTQPQHGWPPAPPASGQPYSGYPPQPQPPQPNSGLAVASLVLGLVGLVFSWFTFGIPSLLALIFGIVGIRQTGPGKRAGRGMAVAGTVLGGVILALGIWVSAALIYSIGSTAESLSNPTSAATVPAPPALPSDQAAANSSAASAPTYTPTVKDFKIALKVKSKDCFGSAGCNVTYQPELTIVGAQVDENGSYEITYEVRGGEDGAAVDTLEVDAGQYQADEGIAQTARSSSKLTAVITDVETN